MNTRESSAGGTPPWAGSVNEGWASAEVPNSLAARQRGADLARHERGVILGQGADQHAVGPRLGDGERQRGVVLGPRVERLGPGDPQAGRARGELEGDGGVVAVELPVVEHVGGPAAEAPLEADLRRGLQRNHRGTAARTCASRSGSTCPARRARRPGRRWSGPTAVLVGLSTSIPVRLSSGIAIAVAPELNSPM